MEVTEEDSPDEALKQFRFQVRNAQEGACVCDCAGPSMVVQPCTGTAGRSTSSDQLGLAGSYARVAPDWGSSSHCFCLLSTACDAGMGSLQGAAAGAECGILAPWLAGRLDAGI